MDSNHRHPTSGCPQPCTGGEVRCCLVCRHHDGPHAAFKACTVLARGAREVRCCLVCRLLVSESRMAVSRGGWRYHCSQKKR
eukprot:207779-Hanusia_phi.AAC.1